MESTPLSISICLWLKNISLNIATAAVSVFPWTEDSPNVFKLYKQCSSRICLNTVYSFQCNIYLLFGMEVVFWQYGTISILPLYSMYCV